jgi:hypothetical protein
MKPLARTALVLALLVVALATVVTAARQRREQEYYDRDLDQRQMWVIVWRALAITVDDLGATVTSSSHDTASPSGNPPASVGGIREAYLEARIQDLEQLGNVLINVTVTGGIRFPDASHSSQEKEHSVLVRLDVDVSASLDDPSVEKDVNRLRKVFFKTLGGHVDWLIEQATGVPTIRGRDPDSTPRYPGGIPTPGIYGPATPTPRWPLR